MPNKCVVSGCNLTRDRPFTEFGDKVHFFAFPLRTTLRGFWLDALESNRGPDFVPCADSFICSHHFEENDFTDRTGRDLRYSAIPSVFNVAPSETSLLKPNVPPAPCICGFKATDVDDLEAHALENRCQIYRCNHCGYITHGRQLLVFHKRTLMFQCELCQFAAETRNELGHHALKEHRRKIEPKSGALVPRKRRKKISIRKPKQKVKKSCQDHELSELVESGLNEVVKIEEPIL